MSPDRVPRARAERAGGSAAPADVPTDLDALRRRIAALERRPPALENAAGGGRAGRPWAFGVGALDDALPEGGLAADGLHEAAGASAADGPAAAAFLAALLVRRVRARECDSERGTVLVCQSRGGAARFGRLHGPGWRDLGLEPADLLILRARREKDVPWAMEEGLRCGALAAVLADAEGIEFAASRRLALAAATGRGKASGSIRRAGHIKALRPCVGSPARQAHPRGSDSQDPPELGCCVFAKRRSTAN